MLPEVRSYKQYGSSFHLSREEAQAARDGIDGFYSHVAHNTGADENGNIVYMAKNSSDFADKLKNLELSRE